MFDSQNFQALPFCPAFGLADKKAQVFPHLLPAGRSNHASPSPQVGILTSAPLSNHKKSQASLFLPFEPFSDLLGSLPCVPPRSPHCVSNKPFHHVLDIVWGHQSWHPKQNFGRTTHSVLSPKPQFIPRQTVGSMKLGFRIIWAALIESVANWKISGFSIPKVINQLRIEIQLSFPFLFLKLTICVIFICQFQS